MSAISLSSGLRSSVNSLVDISKLIDIQNTQISTGNKINSAIDNPNSYFQSIGFRKEASDLRAILDNQNFALSTVASALDALKGITSLLKTIQSLANSALNISVFDSERDLTYLKPIALLLNQITYLTQDAGFNGTNLLRGGQQAFADTLNLVTNTSSTAASQTKIVINAIDINIGGIDAGTTFHTSLSTSGLNLASDSLYDFFSYNAVNTHLIDTGDIYGGLIVGVSAVQDGVFCVKTVGAGPIDILHANYNLDTFIQNANSTVKCATGWEFIKNLLRSAEL
jgi:flagellin